MMRKGIVAALAVLLLGSVGCGDKKTPPAGAGSGSAVGSAEPVGSAATVFDATPPAATFVVPNVAPALERTRTATSQFEVTGTVTVDGKANAISQSSRTAWTDKITKLDGELVTGLEISVTEQADKVGDKAEAPTLLQGKTYLLALDPKTSKLSVKPATGKLAKGESARVEREFSDDVGVPTTLGGVLGGMTFTVGSKAEVPATALTALLALADSEGKTFALTLTSLTEASATFALEGTATLKFPSTLLTATLTGTVVVDPVSGQLRKLEISGDLAAAAPVEFSGTFSTAQSFTFGG